MFEPDVSALWLTIIHYNYRDCQYIKLASAATDYIYSTTSERRDHPSSYVASHRNKIIIIIFDQIHFNIPTAHI